MNHATLFFCGAASGAVLASLFACGAQPKPASYVEQLTMCTEVSDTLQQSLECEDRVRARFGRPLLDAGKDGAK